MTKNCTDIHIAREKERETGRERNIDWEKDLNKKSLHSKNVEASVRPCNEKFFMKPAFCNQGKVKWNDMIHQNKSKRLIRVLHSRMLVCRNEPIGDEARNETKILFYINQCQRERWEDIWRAGASAFTLANKICSMAEHIILLRLCPG